MLSSSNIISFGMPLFDIPTIGNKKWDSSRWVSKDFPSYSTGTYRFDVFGEGGIDSPDLSAGFGDATGLASTNSLAGDRAADAMVGSFGKAALGAGAKAGLGMAFGMSPSDALAMGAQSLAGPGTIGGVLGAGINASLGLDTLGPTQATLAGLASVIGGPLAGAAVAALGGFATNAIADAFDARAMEQSRDLAEDALGHGLTGLSKGKSFADTVTTAQTVNPSTMNVNTMAQTLAQMGINVSPVDAMAAAMADTYGGRTPSPLGALGISPDTLGAISALANDGPFGATPAGTTTQGGMEGSPAGSIGTPGQDSVGAAVAASVAAAADSMSLGDSVSSAVSNAQAAAAEAAAMGDSDAEGSNTGGGNDGGGNGGGDGAGSSGDSGSDSTGGGDHGAASPGDGPGEA